MFPSLLSVFATLASGHRNLTGDDPQVKHCFAASCWCHRSKSRQTLFCASGLTVHGTSFRVFLCSIYNYESNKASSRLRYQRLIDAKNRCILLKSWLFLDLCHRAV